MASRRNDQMPMVTVVTALVTAVVGTVTALFTVYSGLSNGEVWQILLVLYFLALLPISGWMFRSKRRSS